MYAAGANAIASFTMVGVVGSIQVIFGNRSASSSHASGCCPWSSHRCSTVAANRCRRSLRLAPRSDAALAGAVHGRAAAAYQRSDGRCSRRPNTASSSRRGLIASGCGKGRRAPPHPMDEAAHGDLG